MIKTIGNFLTQGNKDFPIDCELLDALQTNTQLVQIIGNIAGDKTVLKGCERVGETKRNAGYVFLCTQHYPQGEVLYWEGGSITSGMYIKLEDIFVTAQGYEYPKAYTKRMLAPGIGIENYKWEDFREIKTSIELEAMLREQDKRIAALASEPLGFVKTWAGAIVPENHVLCDGQHLKITDYPELYAALGTTFNTAYNYAGSKYTTPSGYFRVPDLRGRFIVGQNFSDEDYNKLGNAAGAKKHTLNQDEIPNHSHEFKDYYHMEAPNFINAGLDGADMVGSNLSGSGKSDSDNGCLMYKKHNTESIGKGASHENRPPYFVLAYIMRAK